MKIKRQKNNNMLVWACAWCDSSTYTKLKKGEHYTHGICTFHKVKFIMNFRKTLGARV